VNADRAAASSNRRWLGPLIAVLGAAFPPLFLRVAALDVGPYGGIAPVDWLRIATAAIAGLTVIVLVAALVWRLSRLRFLTALLPATVVYWALAFFWRANLAVADLVSLPGQVGTALLLANVLLDGLARKTRLETETQHQAIDPDALHVTSSRLGSVFGEHTVYLDSPFDQVTLAHRAKNRQGFAFGALKAAEWLPGRKGLFTLDDLLLDF